jgi:hypothetical protein
MGFHLIFNSKPTDDFVTKKCCAGIANVPTLVLARVLSASSSQIQCG